MSDDTDRIAALESRIAALTVIVERLAQAVGQLNLDSYIVHTDRPPPPGAEPYNSESAYQNVRYTLDRVRTTLEEWKD